MSAQKPPEVFWEVEIQLTTKIEVKAPQGDEDAAMRKAIEVVENELAWNDFEPDDIRASEKGGPFDLKLPIKGKTSWRLWHLKSLTREDAEKEVIEVVESLRKSKLPQWQECDFLKREIVEHRHHGGMT